MAQQITDVEKLMCACRELKLRKGVYPRMVASGTLTQAQADEEIARMRAIIEDYQDKTKGDRLL